MATGTIQETGLSKSGKPKVKIDGSWYSIGTTLGFVPGQKIDFEAHEFQFSGKQFWGIDKFALLPTAPVATPQPVYAPMKPATAPVGASPPMSAPVGYTEPERMFISNICAAAITAGKIEDPVDLPAWVNAALYAIRNAKGDLPMPETAVGSYLNTSLQPLDRDTPF